MLKQLPRTLRFMIVGGIAVPGSWGILYLLAGVLGYWYLGSSIFALTCNYIFTFVANKLWTYEDWSTDRLSVQIAEYVGMISVFYVVSAGALYVAVEYFGLWYFAVHVAISGVLSFMSMNWSPKIFARKPPAAH